MQCDKGQITNIRNYQLPSTIIKTGLMIQLKNDIKESLQIMTSQEMIHIMK